MCLIYSLGQRCFWYNNPSVSHKNTKTLYRLVLGGGNTGFKYDTCKIKNIEQALY